MGNVLVRFRMFVALKHLSLEPIGSKYGYLSIIEPSWNVIKTIMKFTEERQHPFKGQQLYGEWIL